jgi:hypothetical protein
LYFVQARTTLGEMVTMACLAAAFSGFAVGCFDARLRLPWRLTLLGLGVLFSALGFFCRGALISVMLPAASVGGAWLLTRHAAPAPLRARGSRVPAWSAVALLAIAAIACGFGGYALLRASPTDYFLALGAEVDPPRQFPTHDFVLKALGHGLFPWSAFLPFAVGLLFTPLRGTVTEQRPVAALRLSALLMVVLGVGVYTVLAPRTGGLPFAPVFAVAIVIALSIDVLDEKTAGAPIVAMGTVALLVLLFTDYEKDLARTFAPHAVGSVEFPKPFAEFAKVTLAVVTGIAALCFALLSLERPARALFRSLSFTWLTSRAVPACGSLALSGLVLSFGYFPALGAQVSPAGAFDAFRERAKPGERLATLGTDARGAIYFGTQSEKAFSADSEALTWLFEAPSERRWLIFKSDMLPVLNSKFRREHRDAAAPRGVSHLPVLDVSSPDDVLASNQLLPGEPNLNPLEALLPAQRPTPHHPMTAEFDDKLRLLGWEVREVARDGALLDATDELRVKQRYAFRLSYEVLAPISRNWKTFIHIDGKDTRFNGDHDTLLGKYPFRHWNPGDFVVDSYEFTLDSSHRPGLFWAVQRQQAPRRVAR